MSAPRSRRPPVRQAARRPARALAGLAAGLAVLLAAPAPACAAAAAADRYVLVPENAARLTGLLAPLPLDEPFADGCRLPSVALERTLVHLTVEERDGRQQRLTLGPPTGAPPAPQRASPSFHILAPAGTDGGLPPCAALVWERIRAADDGTFWEPGRTHMAAEAARAAARQAPSAPRAPREAAPDRPAESLEERLALPFYRLLQVLWLAAALWGLTCLVRRAGALRTLDRPALLALGSAVLAAVVLRLLWAEPALIHENYCGVGRLACADRPPCHGLTGNHSWASFAFYNLALSAGGGSTTAVIATNVVLMGVVLPLLVFALGRDLTGDARAGILGAWALALLPAHARMSPTESFFPAGLAALLASILAVRDLARRGGVGRAVGAAVLVALAVQTSRVYNLHAALAFGVLLLGRPAWRAIGVRGVLAAVATFGALTALHHAELLRATDLAPGTYLPSGPVAFLTNLVTNNLFLDPWLTPLAVIGAWVLGAGLLLVRRPREGATALLVFLGLAVVFLSADPADVDWPTRLRMQVSLTPFVALFAGAGLAALTRVPHRWSGLGLLAALLAAGAPFLPAQHAFVRERLVPALEADFLADALPRLPALDLLVTVDREDRLPDAHLTGDPVETHFPEHELRRQQPGVERRTVGEVLADPSLVAGRRAVFYEGANAHAWLPEELALVGPDPGPRPAVVELRRRFRLTPLEGLTGQLPASNPPSVRFRFPRGPIPVGFHRLEPR